MTSFSAIIQFESSKGGAWVELPFDVKATYGVARPKEKVLFDGQIEYRGSIAVMDGRSILGVRKDVRSSLAKEPGDSIEVELELDLAPRTVEIPAALQARLNECPALQAAFERKSYTQRREWVHSVNEAKRPETSARRINKIIDQIEQNIDA